LYYNTFVDTIEITINSNTPYILPTNDDLIDAKIFKKKSLFKECNNSYEEKGGRVAIVPENSFTKSIQPLFDALEYETVYFNNKQEVEDLIQKPNYTEPFANDTWRQFCFTIEFDEFEQKKFEYTLRFNTSEVWPQGDHWDTVESRPFISFVKDDNTSMNKTKESGIFLLKNYIDSKIFEQEVSKKLTVGVTRFKVDPYKTSNLYDILKTLMTVLIVFILVFPFVRLISQVVTDRETLVLQNMENMGLKKHVYYWFTVVFYYLKSFIIVLVVCVILNFTILKDIGFFLLFFILLLGSYCFINLSFIISCFFIKSKKAIITGLVVFFTLSLGSFILPSIPMSRSVVFFLAILFPSFNLEIIKDGILLSQTNFSKLTFGELDIIIFDIPFYTFFVILILQFVVYMLLGLYCFYVGESFLLV
jgi:hypothetical protein